MTPPPPPAPPPPPLVELGEEKVVAGEGVVKLCGKSEVAPCGEVELVAEEGRDDVEDMSGQSDKGSKQSGLTGKGDECHYTSKDHIS